MGNEDIICVLSMYLRCFPVKALDDISFDIVVGKCMLLGEMVQAKSTLIKILTGCIQQTRPDFVEWARNSATNILESADWESVRYFRKAAVPHLTVAESIFLSREIKN